MCGSLKEHCHTIFQWSSMFCLVSERRLCIWRLRDSHMISGFSLGSLSRTAYILLSVSHTFISVPSLFFSISFYASSTYSHPPAPFMSTNDSCFSPLSPPPSPLSPSTKMKHDVYEQSLLQAHWIISFHIWSTFSHILVFDHWLIFCYVFALDPQRPDLSFEYGVGYLKISVSNDVYSTIVWRNRW